MIKVQIIDISSQITSGLTTEDLEVSVYDNEIQALNALELLQPSVILLHYGLRKEQTSDYIRLLSKAYSESNIVVLANELSDEQILECLVAGAKGYLNVSQLNTFGQKMVKVVDAGEAWISRRMVAKVLERLRA